MGDGKYSWVLEGEGVCETSLMVEPIQGRNSKKIKKETHHFQSPHPPNPNLQLPFHTLNAFKLNAFPPAPPRRFPPEQQQFLCHAYCVAVRQVVAFDVGA